MTKSELIAKLAARYPQLVAKDAELAVKMILDAMAKSLADGQRARGYAPEGIVSGVNRGDRISSYRKCGDVERRRRAGDCD